MTTVILTRNTGEFGFDIQDEFHHSIQTGSNLEEDGKATGFRPMQLLLGALGSCSAIDILTILKKQKQSVAQFKIEVQGEREQDVVPALWKTISVTFILNGNIDPEKAKRAADLSMEKYCSVAETLRRAGAAITWKTAVIQTNENIPSI